jgi:hypothetical protein
MSSADSKKPPPSASPDAPYAGPNVAGSASLSPYPTSRLSPAISLVDTAREIEAAGEVLKSHAGARLEGIARQIRLLQEEARRVLERAQVDLELHQANANFRRTPGHIYHLYRDKQGALVFSMLSPQDHGGTPPEPFLGSYRLEYDRSWTRLEDVAERDRERIDVEELLKDASPELARGPSEG